MKQSLGAKTLIYPSPAVLVGTYDSKGKPNLMCAAWAGICCSSPPCINVSLRKATYTYDGIIKRKAFTVGVPRQSQAKVVDWLGIYSGKNRDKFVEAGLTPVASEVVDAPYAQEFPLVAECELIFQRELGLHTIFIGEIKDVKADEEVLAENGLPDPVKVDPLSYTPGWGRYFSLGPEVGKAHSMGKNL